MTRLFAGTPFDRPPRCERCEQLESECRCPPEAPPPPVRIPPEKQTARLAVEKRKKGKLVTVIRGLDPNGNDLAALLTELRTRCGAGGSLQDDHLEIQGSHLERVRTELKKIGYRVTG
ncbi:MAG: translation initiation factor [Planctomycetaceae bacterium]